MHCQRVMFICFAIWTLSCEPNLWPCVPLQGYAPIRQDYEDFYTRRMYYKIHVRQRICLQTHQDLPSCAGCLEKSLEKSLIEVDVLHACRTAGTAPSAAPQMLGLMFWSATQWMARSELPS